MISPVIRDLAVIARQTMLSYKGRRDDVRSIGRELNADYVIEGTLQVEGQRVRICVQLVDAHTGVDVWTERYDRSAENLFAMLDSVTENVINVLATCHGKLANLRRDAARRKPPASLQAYDCYLLGLEQKHLFTRTFEQGGDTATDACSRARPGSCKSLDRAGSCACCGCLQRRLPMMFLPRLRAGAHVSSKRWRSIRPIFTHA